MAETSNLQIVINAVDNATSVIRGIAKNIDGAFDRAKAPSFALAGAIGAVGGASIFAAAQIEQQEIAFTTLLKSSDKARDTLDRIKKEAKRTPFELPGLTQGTIQLVAAGVEANRAIDDILGLGNAVSAVGKGQPELDRLAVNLQQIKAVGAATAIDIKQFGFAGIPIFDLLAEATGKSVDELKVLQENGGITYDLITDALKKAAKDGGRYANGLEKQSKSFNGIISNIKDTTGIMLSDFAKQTGLFDLIKEGAKRFLIMLETLLPKIITVVNFFKENKQAAIILAGIVIGALVPAFFALAAAAATALFALLPFMAIGAAVAGLYILWSNNFMGIKDITMQVIAFLVTIPETITGIFNGIVETLNYVKNNWQKILVEDLPRLLGFAVGFILGQVINLINFFRSLPAQIGSAIWANRGALIQFAGQMMGALKDVFLAGVNAIIDFFVKLPGRAVGAMKASFKALGNFAGGATEGFKKALGFAQGGYVPGRVGQPQLAVVHGGEKVLSPNMQDVNNNVGGVTINMSGSFNLDSQDRVDELARRITQILGRQTELSKIGVGF